MPAIGCSAWTSVRLTRRAEIIGRIFRMAGVAVTLLAARIVNGRHPCPMEGGDGGFAFAGRQNTLANSWSGPWRAGPVAGSTSDDYGSGFAPERLYGAIKAVRYDGLDVSHLYFQ
jgi:hypothetical protein